MVGPAGGGSAFSTHSLSPVLFSRIVHGPEASVPHPNGPLLSLVVRGQGGGAKRNKKLDEAACLLIMP